MMKKILIILAFLGIGLASHAQTTNPFPTTDSLRKFINKWIRNSAVDAFTNLRLNTALIGISRFIDSSDANGKLSISDTLDMLAGYTRLSRFLDSISALRSALVAANPSNIIVSTTDPVSGDGSNGQYFWNRFKGQLSLKSGGSWSTVAHLMGDTVYPRLTNVYNGPIVQLPKAWDTAAMFYNIGSISRNINHSGNALLPYKDDPIFLRGWNVNTEGSAIQPWKARMLWHDESNYDTRTIGVPYFESHVSVGYPAGSTAAAYTPGSGERIKSLNVAQTNYDIYEWATMNRFWYQTRLVSQGPLVQYFGADALNGFGGLRRMRIDSIESGGPSFMQLDNSNVGQKIFSFGRNRYIWNNSGFYDSTTFQPVGSAFVINSTNVKLNGSSFATGDYNTVSGTYMDNQGHFYGNKGGGQNFRVWSWSNELGISLNKPGTRIAMLDLRSLQPHFDTYWTLNNTIDERTNGVNFNFERTYGSATTNDGLVGSDGWAFNLNAANKFRTRFTEAKDSAGSHLAELVFSTRPPNGGVNSMRDVFNIRSTGKVIIADTLNLSGLTGKTIDTTNLKIVVGDGSGNLFKTSWNIPGSGYPSLTTNYIGYGVGGVLSGSSAYQFNGTTVTQEANGAANSITSTTAVGASSGGSIRLFAKATPTAADQLMGSVQFGTLDGGSTENVTASVRAYANGAHTPGSSEPTNLRFYTSAASTESEVMRLTHNLRVGIGVTSPTARLHLPAGNASAQNAPLKLTSGTNLTTPEAGAEEYDGTSRFFTPGSTRLRYVFTDNSIPSNGQIPIGNGTNYTNATLTPGTGVSVTNGSGSITVALNSSYIAAGDYTPTLTGVTNVDAVTLISAHYIRVNDQVTVDIAVNVDPTSISTLTNFDITLPIASTMTNATNLTGIITSGTGGTGNTIAFSNNARTGFEAMTTSSQVYNIHFMYRIQ